MSETEPINSDKQIRAEARRRISIQGKAEIVDILGNLETAYEHQSDRNRADNIACQMEQSGEYVIYFLPWEKDRIYVKRNPNKKLTDNLINTNVTVKLATIAIAIATVITAIMTFMSYKSQQQDIKSKQRLQSITRLLHNHTLSDSLLRKSVKEILETP